MWKQIQNLAQVLPLVLAAACASATTNGDNIGPGGGGGGGGNGDGGTGDGGNNENPNCVGRQCQVKRSCPAGSPTTLSGTVTIPAGNLPLYNANVYIPSGAVPPAPQSGPSCDRCSDVVPTDAAAKTTTDVNGNFTLVNVPSGKDIPLVIRVGKWRRVVTIPSIADCTTTPLDVTQTRLPRNKSEGNIPKIALSTGNQDALECLLRSKKLGIDDSEFTPPAGGGRINLYAGGQRFNGTAGADTFDTSLGGAPFPSSNPWWNDVNNWNQYDIVMLSCEGDQNPTFKSAMAHTALESFINNGGRVFASHWHNIWLSGATTGLNTVASFVSSSSSTGYINDTTPILADIDQSFTRGKALATWLQLPAVKGTSNSQLGKLQINNSRVTLTGKNQSLTQSWVNYDDAAKLIAPLMNPASQYFSFNAPLNAPPQNQCGQMVFTDIHVSGGKSDVSNPTKPFPTGCTSTGLTPQESALIFMLFDLTNCLQVIIG